MSIVLQSSGGGQITIQEPATASNFTQTLPAATGTVMVSGNMPAFSYYQSASQTLATSTFTKITFTTSEFDTTSGMYASSRFTPTVAGYYQVSASISPNASICGITVSLYKNGSLYKNLSNNISVSQNTGGGSGLIYLNGSTDYVEIYGQFSVGQAVQALAQSTYFQAVLVRAA